LTCPISQIKIGTLRPGLSRTGTARATRHNETLGLSKGVLGKGLKRKRVK
jgi:hypothetical protein